MTDQKNKERRIYCESCDRTYIYDKTNKEHRIEDIMRCICCRQLFLWSEKRHPCTQNTMRFASYEITQKETDPKEKTCIFFCPKPECNIDRKETGWCG